MSAPVENPLLGGEVTVLARRECRAGAGKRLVSEISSVYPRTD